jgi:hypothetical protein
MKDKQLLFSFSEFKSTSVVPFERFLDAYFNPKIEKKEVVFLLSECKRKRLLQEDNFYPKDRKF